MAYTAQLDGFQSIIWQDEGDGCDAVLIVPEASGNLTWCRLQQGRENVSLNAAGAKELIKELQWFVRNQDEVIKGAQA